MIGIITYDKPHRKTQDLVTKLFLNGYNDLHLIVIPWIDRKNFIPIFKHRPTNCVEISTEELCERFNIKFSRVDIKDLHSFFLNDSFNHIIIGGAGILPNNLAKDFKIINGHPGYLPNVRGLDALKWAIFNGQPIGVTTHYISDKADEGELIERRIIPIYFEDSFHSVANRVYETEIEMLVNSIYIIENNLASLESLTDERYIANRRMSHHNEIIMINRFEEIRKKSKSHRTE